MFLGDGREALADLVAAPQREDVVIEEHHADHLRAVMAGLEPGVEPLGSQRDRVRPGDANRIEAERLRPLDECLLESRDV